MKIAVIMMCCNVQPSIRNREAFEEYVVKDYNMIKNHLEHEYSFIFYHGSDDADRMEDNVLYRWNDEGSDLLENCYEITTKTNDGVHSTFEKTIECFNMLEQIDDFDWIIRTNISTYVNIRLFDHLADTLDKSQIYCNAINTNITSIKYMNYTYPRGDFYIIHKNMIDKILDVADEFYIDVHKLDFEKCFSDTSEHVDDVIIGCCLYKALGKEYFKCLNALYYKFFPEYIIGNTNVDSNLNKHVLSVRLKTIPPGKTFSGYSWADNDYRKSDVVKFRKCYEYYSNKKYTENISIANLIIPKNTGRPTVFCTLHNVYISNIENELMKKGEN